MKGVVGASALGATGVTGASAIKLTTSSSGEGGGATQYFGIENVAGPAPRGMPQIPIEIDDEGYLKGVWPEGPKPRTVNGQQVSPPTEQIGGYTYTSEWFQYCGVQTYAGLAPDADQDNFLRVADSAGYEWMSDLSAGDRLNVDDFEDYETWNNEIGQAGIGKPAMATWRSQDLSPQETIPVQVLRSTRIEELANGGSEYADWVNASTQDGFIAWLNKCTHFCCVPGFKASDQSARFGAANEVYCPCHQSVYDPFSIDRLQFTALPRPEDLGESEDSGSESTSSGESE